MKKRIALILLMILSLGILSSCTGSDGGEWDFVRDFLNKPIGYIIIGGLTLYLVFKYGGSKK